MNKSVIIRKVFLLSIAIGFCITGKVFASDNVLQAIQVDGVKDSYNIILKSDDVADLKKTVQAPNKMILNLKGIRASKTINTIYNNTSSVDSVVVEPTGEESVKILIQGDNVGNAEIHFDTLKTPLGVLDKTEKKKASTDQIVLSGPMNSYKPVYEENFDEENAGFSLTGAMSSPAAKYTKKILKNEKISWMITFGLFAIMLLGGAKAIRGKDSEIKVGLTQSLKEREIELFKGLANDSNLSSLNAQPNVAAQQLSGNYGIKAYQNGTRSPYASSEIQRPRHAASPISSPQPAAQGINSQPTTTTMQGLMQNSIQKTALKTPPITGPKTTNIDSIKFLESMTKIYEKNGRSDLAQGLKTNMKKAKVNLA